jgi:hypothetical protein
LVSDLGLEPASILDRGEVLDVFDVFEGVGSWVLRGEQSLLIASYPEGTL